MFRSRSGFTLIEIVSVLVILGILAAVAVPKYFDLQAEAEKKAALSSVAEAQARIQLSFGQQLLQGKTCEEAANAVSDITALSDDTVTRITSARFGEFYLTAGTITVTGTPVSAQRGEDGTLFDTGAKLYLPACDGEIPAASAYMSSTVMNILNKLLTEGHDYRDNEDFKKQYGVLTSIGNNIQACIDLSHGVFWGNSNSAQMKIDFFNTNTNEKMNIRFTYDVKSNQFTIDEMNVINSSGEKKRVIAEYSGGSATDSASLTYAKQVVQNMGLNTSVFGTAFERFDGKVTNIDADNFKF